MAARARAKAEAAKARVAFVQKESELKFQAIQTAVEMTLREAQLAAELSLLQLQRDAAAAQAEAEVLSRQRPLQSPREEEPPLPGLSQLRPQQSPREEAPPELLPWEHQSNKDITPPWNTEGPTENGGEGER